LETTFVNRFRAPFELKSIEAVDKLLGNFVSRIFAISEDHAEIGRQLETIAATPGFNVESSDEVDHLQSSAYKLAQEGLTLTNLIISRVVRLGKTLQAGEPTKLRQINSVADFVHEHADPQFHKILNESARHRYV
jgi:hypothetical protein